MDELIRKQDVIDAIHRYFFGTIEATETFESEDGEIYDMKLVEPLLEHNKALSKRIESLPSLPSAQPEVQSDGTLHITVDTDISQIRRVLVSQEGTQYGNLYYADAEPQWIPCSERLPAYGEDVLISIGGYCNVGHIVPVNEEEQYNWYFSGWYHLPNDVDAWMPLPEPYKEKDNEKA